MTEKKRYWVVLICSVLFLLIGTQIGGLIWKQKEVSEKQTEHQVTLSWDMALAGALALFAGYKLILLKKE